MPARLHRCVKDAKITAKLSLVRNASKSGTADTAIPAAAITDDVRSRKEDQSSPFSIALTAMASLALILAQERLLAFGFRAGGALSDRFWALVLLGGATDEISAATVVR
jgi:hypothetical protein